MMPARGWFDVSPPPEARVTMSLAVILAVSLLLGLGGALASLWRRSGPVRLPAAVTVPARAPRARRRGAR
jgi:hypothetical protein